MLLSQPSLADGEQHLRHVDVVDRAVIGTGEESGRKRTAQRNSRLENNTELMAKTWPFGPAEETGKVVAKRRLAAIKRLLLRLSPTPAGDPQFLAPPSDISTIVQALSGWPWSRITAGSLAGKRPCRPMGRLDANRHRQKKNRDVVDAPEHIDPKAWLDVEFRMGGGVDKDAKNSRHSHEGERHEIGPLDDDALAA